MHIFDLNRDVFLSAVSSMDQKSLWAFSLASRTAQNAAIPFLLSSIQLSRSYAQIDSCCEYLLRHPTRIALVKRLNIYVPYRPDVWSLRPLTEVLRQACNLQRLCLLHSESLLQIQPDMVTAITRCPRLTALYLFGGGGELTRKVIREIGPLRTLSVELASDAIITPLIERSAPTLEELAVVTSLPPGFVLPLTRTHCWPHLRILYMIGVPTRTLASAFPNIQNLTLSTPLYAAGLNTHIFNEQDIPSWPKLDYIRGNLPALCSLALPTCIRELDISTQLHSCDASEQDLVLDIIQRTQPLALILRTKPGPRNESFYHRFARCAGRLQYLELHHVNRDNFIFDQLHLKTSESLQITYIYFHAIATRTDVNLDSIPFVHQISDFIPSVKYIEMGWDPSTTRSMLPPRNRTWEVIRSEFEEDGRTIREISVDYALSVKREWVVSKSSNPLW